MRLEDFVRANHPLRPIHAWVNDALATMDARFSAMYEAHIKGGRPSIAPEKLTRAMLLQVLYSIRSERQLVEAPAVRPMRAETLKNSVSNASNTASLGRFGPDGAHRGLDERY